MHALRSYPDRLTMRHQTMIILQCSQVVALSDTISTLSTIETTDTLDTVETTDTIKESFLAPAAPRKDTRFGKLSEMKRGIV